jgi:hypothetical protein
MRILLGTAITVLSLGIASNANAQMGQLGANLFQKPAIAKFVNPVLGKGAEYESTNANSPGTRTMEMGVIGKESVDGKDGFWMQIVTNTNKGQSMVAKALVTKDDFQFHKMIMQMGGQPAMEMPFNPYSGRDQKMQEAMNDWHSLGTETITVPAGTFLCEHYKNDKNGSELWASDKVTPFGMVKQVGKDSSMVLVKVLNDVPDKITGPVTKFDPQQFMQQHQQSQQPKP